MLLGVEFKCHKDEHGRRWFRLAPVIQDGTIRDLRFFAAVFAVAGMLALATYGLYATDVPDTRPTAEAMR